LAAEQNIFTMIPKQAILIFTAALLLGGGTACRPRTQPPPSQRPASSTNGQTTLTGRVVRIADGDTVTILDSTNTQHRIRLQGIDAPESHQAFGTQSKKSLSDMVFDKDVTVEYDKIDRYGRLVGKIILNGVDVCLEQIKAGMAWHYKDYEDEQTPADRDLYARAEDDARNARRGLWADANPIEPSEYRRDERERK
jgi:endonuclease YncB( thermonuclease family)